MNKVDLMVQRRLRLLEQAGFRKQEDGTYKLTDIDVEIIWCERFKAGITIIDGDITWLSFIELMDTVKELKS
jgi:hypothetical protein